MRLLGHPRKSGQRLTMASGCNNCHVPLRIFFHILHRNKHFIFGFNIAELAPKLKHVLQIFSGDCKFAAVLDGSLYHLLDPVDIRREYSNDDTVF